MYVLSCGFAIEYHKLVHVIVELAAAYQTSNEMVATLFEYKGLMVRIGSVKLRLVVNTGVSC
jgi:hypothetical protein